MSYNPWADLRQRQDITFGVTRLPWDRGWWVPAERGIVLDDRLSQVERRCVLAHELVHAENDDQPCGRIKGAARVGLRQEQRARRQAAIRLVDLIPLIDAAMWCHSIEEMAAELVVDVPTLLDRIACLEDEDRRWIARRLSERGEVA